MITILFSFTVALTFVSTVTGSMDTQTCNATMKCPSPEVCCKATSSGVLIATCSLNCYNHPCTSDMHCISDDLYCDEKWCKLQRERPCEDAGMDCLYDNRSTKYQYCCNSLCSDEPCSDAAIEVLRFIVSILISLVLVVAMVVFCWRVSLYYRRMRPFDSDDDLDRPLNRQVGL